MLKKIIIWLGIFIGFIIIALAMTVLVLKNKTEKGMEKIYTVEPEKIIIPTDSISIKAGKQWAHTLCADCHGGDSFEGKKFFSDPKLGTIYTPNLTAGVGGVGSKYSDHDWVRAIRHGIKPDGTPIIIMPSKDFHNMSEEHLGQLIAYIKTVPPVDKTHPSEPELKPMAKILAAVGAFGTFFAATKIDHSEKFETAPLPGPTVEYGNYLVDVFGCNHCHGEQLNGGKDPDPNAPFAPNITPGGDFGYWGFEGFKTAMRTGQTPNGRQLSYYMPWQATKNMSDENLEAVYNYLKSLPALETAPH